MVMLMVRESKSSANQVSKGGQFSSLLLPVSHCCFIFSATLITFWQRTSSNKFSSQPKRERRIVWLDSLTGLSDWIAWMIVLVFKRTKCEFLYQMTCWGFKMQNFFRSQEGCESANVTKRIGNCNGYYCIRIYSQWMFRVMASCTLCCKAWLVAWQVNTFWFIAGVVRNRRMLTWLVVELLIGRSVELSVEAFAMPMVTGTPSLCQLSSLGGFEGPATQLSCSSSPAWTRGGSDRIVTLDGASREKKD